MDGLVDWQLGEVSVTRVPVDGGDSAHIREGKIC
jgi:hypothetical protein